VKFPQLAIGQRFSCKGKTYAKTGPLTAREETTGKSRLMMKSALVTPLDPAEAPAERRERHFSEREVRELFDLYRQRLRNSLTDNTARMDPSQLAQIQRWLDDQPLPFD
jgi:hypothetical protein